MGLLEDARAWRDAKEKQAQEIADRLRSTARQAEPAALQFAEAVSPTVVAPIAAAGGVLKQGLTPTTPTAEDQQQDTLPPAPPPTTQQQTPAAPQTFVMPSGGGGGGSSRSSTSITQGAQIAPETRAMLDESGREKVAAIEQGASAQEQQNDQDAQQARQTANYMEKQRLLSAMDPVALHKQHAIAEARQNLSDLQNERIDSQHFAKSQNLGQKLTWALGMALGGFASGMRGGPNTAAQLYSQAIQDDIDAQRANIGHKTEIQKGLLGDLQNDFKDYKQQDAAAQIIGMNIFLKRLEAEKTEGKSAIVQANKANEIAAAKNQIALQHINLDEATSNKATRNYETVSGGGGGGVTPQALADKRLEVIKMLQGTGKPFTAADVNNVLATMYGAGGTLPDMTKASPTGQTAVDVAGIQKIGDAAAAVKAKDVLGSVLPSAIAPASNMAMQKIEDYRSTVRGTLKSLEPRLTDDELDKQVKAYEVTPAMPEAVAKQRVASFMARIKASNAAKGKAVAPDGTSPAAVEDAAPSAFEPE